MPQAETHAQAETHEAHAAGRDPQSRDRRKPKPRCGGDSRERRRWQRMAMARLHLESRMESREKGEQRTKREKNQAK